MKTTIKIDDDLLAKAAKLTGVTRKSALVKMGLKSLVAVASAKRLASLGGTEKSLKPIRRRRG
ncbi:MAG: type II toxin-antitoxin system VapB family antitoxin [Gammaproteobacteria bacterium]|nr:type II toxin-antitoxin system VapB family antitoxin [Gammaproteobacteria bacterium]